MAKQKIVEVDEDLVRGMVTADIPRLKNKEEARLSDRQPDIVDSPAASEPSVDSPASKYRRKREPKDYAAQFLKKRESAQKRQTYINMSLFVKLTDILAVIAPDTTVPTFLDNVLTHHLEQFRDEINELYTEKFKKPL